MATMPMPGASFVGERRVVQQVEGVEGVEGVGVKWWNREDNSSQIWRNKPMILWVYESITNKR